MKARWDNGVVQLFHGDARQVLRGLPGESVHCVVTSPPYWGLRDYGLGPDALGLEPTIDLYVHHIVEVFREVRRVLRKDGTLWLNMGDSYGAQQGVGFNGNKRLPEADRNMKVNTGLKPKDLCMMPARVALALQADGWWLRSDIVWSKPNPMPESVTDRPTRAHEYVFLLTKSARYYYDADAIREPQSESTHARYGKNGKRPSGQKIAEPGSGIKANTSFKAATNEAILPNGRNKRSVWEIATEAYPEAHFATFPQKLVEPCILAGTSERGVCPDCGAPCQRVVERVEPRASDGRDQYGAYSVRTPRGELGTPQRQSGHGGGTAAMPSTRGETTGWRPTCECDHEDTVPGIVLDPFAGSGTVAYVAQRLGRRAIGIDLNAEYLALAEKRMRGQTLPMPL